MAEQSTYKTFFWTLWSNYSFSVSIVNLFWICKTSLFYVLLTWWKNDGLFRIYNLTLHDAYCVSVISALADVK